VAAQGHFLVGMDTHGIIQGVVMDYNSEPYGYFSVDPPKFVEQFKNKSIRDPFQIGRDIAAVIETEEHTAAVFKTALEEYTEGRRHIQRVAQSVGLSFE